jgi:hypothetical protein
VTLFRSALAWFAFSLAGAACAASAVAQEHTCPWITEGTAAALLGGDVETSVVQGKAEDGTCRFMRADHHDQHDQHDQKAASELDLTVARTKDPASTFATYIARCRSGKTVLGGIGNEAYVCDLASGTGIIGRVRDAAFLLLLDAKTPDGASLRAHLADAAEQVAGNLF